MKSFFAALALCATLPGMTLAQNLTTPEYYEMEVGIGYEILWPASITRATQLGVPLRGEINFELTFVRPECLAHYDASRTIYSATKTDLKVFNQTMTTGLPGESRMVLEDKQSGYDIFQFAIHIENMSIGGQNLGFLSMRTFNLPPDALSSEEFLTDAGLIEDILNYPQLQVYAQLENTATPAFFMQTNSASVKITHFPPLRPTAQTPNAFAKCTPPRP